MIYQLLFSDKTEFAQAKSELNLLQSYAQEIGVEEFLAIEKVTEISEENAKTIMLRNTEFDEDEQNDMPEKISLFDMVVGDDFVLVGSTEWD